MNNTWGSYIFKVEDAFDDLQNEMIMMTLQNFRDKFTTLTTKLCKGSVV